MFLGESSTFHRFETYLIIAAALTFSTLQLMNLNKGPFQPHSNPIPTPIVTLASTLPGLVLWTAVKNLPIYNVALIVVSTSYGSIYYREIDNMGVGAIVAFLVGILIISVGVLLLTLQVTPDQPLSRSANMSYRQRRPPACVRPRLALPVTLCFARGSRRRSRSRCGTRWR